MMKTSAVPADLDLLIRAVLERASKGLSAHQVHVALPRAARPSREAVAAELRRLAGAGAAHAWPGGKSPLYGARPFEEVLRERVEALVREAPRTEAQLRKGVPAEAHPLVRQLIADLVGQGRLHHHPKVRGREVFGAEPADPLPELRPLVEAAVARLVRKGFPEAGVRAALGRLAGGRVEPAAVSAEDLILQTIAGLNPAPGALVYVPHVRVAVGARLGKEAFDRAMLALLSQRRVQLQAHPVPSQLNASEKEAMLPDGRGSYYMAVGLVR